MHSLVIPFDDIFKNLSLVVSYTPVMLHSQWRYHHCTRDIPVTRFHLMPFPEVEILVGGGGREHTASPPPLSSYHGRIQALSEIGNRFQAHKNRCPNFARSIKDIILVLFNSS